MTNRELFIKYGKKIRDLVERLEAVEDVSRIGSEVYENPILNYMIEVAMDLLYELAYKDKEGMRDYFSEGMWGEKDLGELYDELTK